MNQLPRIFFIITALLFIVSTQFAPYPASWALKVLPMLILIGITAFSATEKSHKLFLTGLVFSALGDFFLEYNPVGWFIFGLGSFLIAHIFYILALWPLAKQRLPFVALLLLAGGGVFSLLYASLGELLIPVIVYMLVLLFMSSSTLMSKKSNTWLITGGICFVLSDALLAVNKFYTPVPFSSLLIMTTYYAAQFSLTNGFIPRKIN